MKRIILDNFRDWEWYDNTPTKLTYIHLLTKTETTPVEIYDIKLEPGEALYNIASLSRDLGLTTNQVRAALDHLVSSGDITLKQTGRYTVSEIRDWTHKVQIKT